METNYNKARTKYIYPKEEVKNRKKKKSKSQIIKKKNKTKNYKFNEFNESNKLNQKHNLSFEDKDVLYKIIENFSSDEESIDSLIENNKEIKREKEIEKCKHRKNKEYETNEILVEDGKNKLPELEKNNIDIDQTNSNCIINELNNNISYKGKDFKKYKKWKKSKNKNNIIAIYKCKLNRKDEKIRRNKKLGSFCNSTLEIKEITINNNVEFHINMSIPHSKECNNFYNYKNDINKSEKINEYINFRNEVFDYLNNILIYDRKECKKEIQKIYNSKKYNFLLKSSTIINLINKWKNSSIKFTKFNALENPNDYDNDLFLREHRVIYLYMKNNKQEVEYEYFIWANNISISHMRKSKHIFIDATFHTPYGFYQNLIIMFKDILTGEKYPAFYILMNKKYYILYEMIFQSIFFILTQNNLYSITFESLITDDEKALLKAAKKIFPIKNNYICLYHFKKDIFNNARTMGLLKKEIKNEIFKVISLLTKLTIDYKGNINYVYNNLNIIKENHKNYTNLIDNYFIKNKLSLFISGEVNYNIIPKDCLTNNSLENYNKIMKESLGKNRFIHWLNFLHFIKMESSRIKNKIISISNHNILYSAKKTKLGLDKYLEFKDINININEKNPKQITETNYNNIHKSWLINSQNSCRYDVFITLYGFCIKDTLYKENYKFNDIFNTLNLTFEDLIENPLSNSKFALWEYFYQQKIDPIDYLKNTSNKDCLNNNSNCVGLEGYIAQLFIIFKGDNTFCIYEKKQIICQFCNNIIETPNNAINQFIQISKNDLIYTGIEESFLNKLKTDSMEFCSNCQKDINERTFKKCKIAYIVESYPIFLFIIFDMGFNELLTYKDKIIFFSKIIYISLIRIFMN